MCKFFKDYNLIFLDSAVESYQIYSPYSLENAIKELQGRGKFCNLTV